MKYTTLICTLCALSFTGTLMGDCQAEAPNTEEQKKKALDSTKTDTQFSEDSQDFESGTYEEKANDEGMPSEPATNALPAEEVRE
jgi:hypothetical protein